MSCSDSSLDLVFARPAPASRPSSARCKTASQVVFRQRLQYVDAGTRQQRVIQFERRVLRGRPDKRQRAILDERQERILLRLVEAMHLVEKQHACRDSASADVAAASATALRMSFTPAMTADSAMKCESVVRAISRASVVFPVPGGPQKTIECARPCSMARSSGLPSSSRCRCPENSARRCRSHPIGERVARYRSAGSEAKRSVNAAAVCRAEYQSSTRRLQPPRPAIAIARPMIIPAVFAAISSQSAVR